MNTSRKDSFRAQLKYSSDELKCLCEVLELQDNENIPLFPNGDEVARRIMIYKVVDTFPIISDSCLPKLFDYARSQKDNSGLRTKEHYTDDPVRRDAWGKMQEAKEKFYEAIRAVENKPEGDKTIPDAIGLFEEALLRCQEVVDEIERQQNPDPKARAERHRKLQKARSNRRESAKLHIHNHTQFDLNNPEVVQDILNKAEEIFSHGNSRERTKARLYRVLAQEYGIEEVSVRNALDRRLPKKPIIEVVEIAEDQYLDIEIGQANQVDQIKEREDRIRHALSLLD